MVVPPAVVGLSSQDVIKPPKLGLSLFNNSTHSFSSNQHDEDDGEEGEEDDYDLNNAAPLNRKLPARISFGGAKSDYDSVHNLKYQNIGGTTNTLSVVVGGGGRKQNGEGDLFEGRSRSSSCCRELSSPDSNMATKSQQPFKSSTPVVVGVR